MKQSPKKTAANQFEFPFVELVETNQRPPLNELVHCVQFVPEPKTIRLWVPIFADRPPSENRFRYRRYV